ESSISSRKLIALTHLMSPGGISPNDAGSLSKELVCSHFRERLLPVLANQTKHLNLACYVTATAGRAAGSMLWFMRKKFVGSCLLLSAATRSQNLKFAQQRSRSSSLYVAAIAEAHARLGN